MAPITLTIADFDPEGATHTEPIANWAKAVEERTDGKVTFEAAINLAPRGIRVNAVAPGVIDTPMMDGYGPERRAALEARIPLGRMGTPADVADAVLFLCGPRSTYVTGQTIAVNGGIFM